MFKLRTLAVNGLLIVLPVYIPLFLYSTYWLYSYKNAPQILAAKPGQIQEKHQRDKSLREGYLPVFFPNTIKRNAKKNTDIFPIGSLPLTKTHWCNEGYGLVRYKSDRFGLRNDDSQWNDIGRKSNIFFVGDSFVHGACVENTKTIPSFISRMTGINSLNLGMGSNGPYEYMALLKNLVNPIVNADSGYKQIVVLAFYTNDNWPDRLFDNRYISRSVEIVSLSKTGQPKVSAGYSEKVKNMIKESYPITPSSFLKIKESNSWKNSSIYKALTLKPVRNIFKNIISFSTPYNSTPSIRAIRLLKEVCSRNCQPYVLFIPNSNFWDPDAGSIKYKNSLRDESNALGIKFIDATSVIDQNNRSHYAPYGAHLSEEGYMKVSTLIKDSLDLAK